MLGSAERGRAAVLPSEKLCHLDYPSENHAGNIVMILLNTNITN